MHNMGCTSRNFLKRGCSFWWISSSTLAWRTLHRRLRRKRNVKRSFNRWQLQPILVLKNDMRSNLQYLRKSPKTQLDLNGNFIFLLTRFYWTNSATTASLLPICCTLQNKRWNIYGKNSPQQPFLANFTSVPQNQRLSNRLSLIVRSIPTVRNTAGFKLKLNNASRTSA